MVPLTRTRWVHQPEKFTFTESITIMVMVVLGGPGNIMGVTIGAIILTFLPERFREFDNLRLLFFGAALVLLMINRPQGLLPRQRLLNAFCQLTSSPISWFTLTISLPSRLQSTCGSAYHEADAPSSHRAPDEGLGGIRAVNQLDLLVGAQEIVAVIRPQRLR